MSEKKGLKIRFELTPEFEIAEYANVAAVTAAEHEVYITFAQVIMPITEAEEAVAKPVARVAIPPAVAKELCKILAGAQKQ